MARLLFLLVKAYAAPPCHAARDAASRSGRRLDPEMTGPFDKIDHLGCRMDRQRMIGGARSWRDESCHFASKVKLPIRCFRDQRDHQVLQRDNPNAKLHQLGICQLRNLRLSFSGKWFSVPLAGAGAAFIFPS